MGSAWQGRGQGAGREEEREGWGGGNLKPSSKARDLDLHRLDAREEVTWEAATAKDFSTHPSSPPRLSWGGLGGPTSRRQIESQIFAN